MNYFEAIQFLYQLRWFGTKFGLENTCKLAALAGNPEQQLRFIHVAGTNGKGSTCAMIESIYRTAGRRMGLFTSPHLVAFGERIQVNRRLIPPDDVVRLVSESKKWIEAFPAQAHPTFFEVVTVMALRYFVEQKCELVVWETGLGGRLDATNIVTPLISVITNVQFDHQQWLGQTLPEIASEKAGIIKHGVPVVTGAEGPDALGVIARIAQELEAPLTVVTTEDAAGPPLDRIQLPLRGVHQKRNAALALAVARSLQHTFPVGDPQITAGLERVRWAGRLQIERTSSGQTIILDGAHNPAGAEALRAALTQLFPDRMPALILGILQDKDWTNMCRILAPLASAIYLAPVGSERTADPVALARVCREANSIAAITVCLSLDEALHHNRPAPLVVITGSLHFIGEAMEQLRIVPSAGQERLLNEWGAGHQSKR